MKWQLKSQEPKTDTNQIINQLLENRGITNTNEVEEFLNPQLPTIDELVNRVKLDSKQLEKAVERIKKAIDKNEPIVIHGDYDVDGICGTAILWEAIYYGLGYKNVTPFIPHRIDHGYGLSKESIEEIRNHQPPTTNHQLILIITTDCGVSAIDAIKHAKSLGFDTIITDHHAKGEKLPDAIAILHTYDLAGAGIAYLLAQATTNHPPDIATRSVSGRGQPPTTNQLELVALATIADLQPLLGVNRILTKFGLEELNHTQRVGLRALMQVAGLEGKKIGPYEVGWILAPRLNAMGRLEDAMDSLRLLCTKNQVQAEELASRLNRVNQERQQMTEKAYKQAREAVRLLYGETVRQLKNGEKDKTVKPACAGRPSNRQTDQLFVLYHDEWHEGIIGLVAAKITEEFYRPTIAIARSEKISKGSARSINGINIIETIMQYRELLIDVGGHEMAAGFSIETEKIEEFSNQLNSESVRQLVGDENLIRTLKIDLELALSDITPQLYQQLKKLEPHGIGNPGPTFLTRNVEIVDLKTVGQQNKHLKLTLRQPPTTRPTSLREALAGAANHQPPTNSAIGFNLGKWMNKLSTGNRIDIVYQIQEDTFNGYTTLQLKLKDLRLTM